MLLIFETVSAFSLDVLRIFITVLYDIFPDVFSEYLIFGLGGKFLTSKVWRQLLKMTLHNDNYWRNTALKCWNNVVTIRNNVATMLKYCVALKIVVANRLV